MTLFGNVYMYVHVQERAGDKYQCNKTAKEWLFPIMSSSQS